MTKQKEKKECGAWVELPCPQPPTGPSVKGVIAKCDRGKHRGKDHTYSFEFFIEEGGGGEPWRNATIEWRS